MTTTAPQKLFTPPIALKHRVIMAPLIRTRSLGSIPNESWNYYHAPSIYTQEQIRAWKKVTDAVHKKGGYIFCQLWHVGRTTHPSNLQGLQPVAPSRSPRAMTIKDIKNTIDVYVHAAKPAIAAVFDGVELHVEERARFALDVVDAVIKVIGAERTGIRLSPFGFFQYTFTGDPVRDYGYVMVQLEKRRLAYPQKLATLIERAKARGVQNLEDELGIRPLWMYFISNPDLPERLKHKRELNMYVRDILWTRL
ncbi:hypothetical protein EV426DRAFT_632469 [Tirmania nivea]|nr:hypothetical protein EV426DRAFT_632469 [Tirmania nivea]